ncbi:hypothetical protein VUR80DRAFT_7690 [Thermomyces stellatus]
MAEGGRQNLGLCGTVGRAVRFRSLPAKFAAAVIYQVLGNDSSAFAGSPRARALGGKERTRKRTPPSWSLMHRRAAPITGNPTHTKNAEHVSSMDVSPLEISQDLL